MDRLVTADEAVAKLEASEIRYTDDIEITRFFVELAHIEALRSIAYAIDHLADAVESTVKEGQA